MSTYKWSVPVGKQIDGQTYIKDTDNKIYDTISDLVDFVNSEGSHTGAGLVYDLVDKTSTQTITGNKVFTNATITGSLSGNASTATSASKLTTSRTISLSGDVTGSASFDGSSDATINVTVADDSHNHSASTITNLSSLLSGKANTDGSNVSGTWGISISGNASTATNSINATNASNSNTVGGYSAGSLMNAYDNGHSFSTDGYQKLGNGLIMQWGYRVGLGSVSFPIAFPNSCLNVTATLANNSNDGREAPIVSSLSTSSFNLNALEGMNVYWFAIGY